jgi:hypothetical protein
VLALGDAAKSNWANRFAKEPYGQGSLELDMREGVMGAALLVTFMVPGSAEGAARCVSKIGEVRVLYDGTSVIFPLSAPPFAVAGNAVGRDALLSTALSAKMADRQVAIEFGTDGTVCTSNSAVRGDFISLALL